MKQVRFTIDGETFDVTIQDLNENPIRVTVNGESILVVPEIAPESPPPSSASRPSAPSAPPPSPVEPSSKADSTAIFSPIPGVVNAISVNPGDTVTVGQEVIVLEAMKMNNIIRSPREGIISAVHVHIGQQVQHHAMLVEFKSKQGD
ncbi:MAG: hypothetical protein JXA97_04210 [Anaerolineales bacterium]|nr:hypothetical protein [Anaerolineales bacterium]